MTEGQLRLFTESVEQSTDIMREARKKITTPRLFGRVNSEEIQAWLDGELLKVWSKYVVFCTKEHCEMLLRKRRNLRTKGDYGEVDITAWEREIRYFLSEALNLKDAGDVMERIGALLIGLVDPILDELGGTAPPKSNDMSIDSLSPQQYEELCAEEMRGIGYDVRMTKASGDQGVDVIAQKGAVTIVLQCHSCPN
jgi:Restriction endonuclease